MGMSTVRGAPQWTSWYIFDVEGCWVMVVIYMSSTALIRRITDVQRSLQPPVVDLCFCTRHCGFNTVEHRSLQ